MAAGGIRDHLGGGFARYATDSVWLVPHFEKMLYDNAQLALGVPPRLAGDGRGASRRGRPSDARLHGPRPAASRSGMASSGSPRAWMPTRTVTKVAPTSGRRPRSTGSWDRMRRCSRPRTASPRTATGRARPSCPESAMTTALARTWSMSRDEVAERLSSARDRLFAVATARTQPARDDKVLASWNGLAMVAFAEAGRVLPDAERYAQLATDLAASLARTRLADPRRHGCVARGRTVDRGRRRCWRITRTWQPGCWRSTRRPSTSAGWRGRPSSWTSCSSISATPQGGFHDTADDADGLFARPRSLVDSPLPSGNAMAVTVLLQIGRADRPGTLPADARRRPCPGCLGVAARHPTAFAQWLVAAGMLLVPIDEVAIVGDRDDASTRGAAGSHQVRIPAVAGRCLCERSLVRQSVPLLRDRVRVDGRPAAYVCHGFSCQLPVTDPDALRTQLRRR